MRFEIEADFTEVERSILQRLASPEPVHFDEVLPDRSDRNRANRLNNLIVGGFLLQLPTAEGKVYLTLTRLGEIALQETTAVPVPTPDTGRGPTPQEGSAMISGMPATQNIDPELLDILVCPLTRSKLRQEGDELVAEKPKGAGLRYPIRDGIPILLVDEAKLPAGVASLEEFKRTYALHIPA